MAIETRLTARDYKTDVHNNWCPGCGDFGILTAIQSALAQLKIPPHRVAVFSGIGCSGKAPHYINAYGFHTLHGRALPTATGAKLANLDLTGLIAAGIEHKGSAFIDVLQTCPTYNDLYTKDWYQGARDSQPRLYKLEEQGYDPVVRDPANPEEMVAKKLQAIGKSYEWGARIPLGIYYQALLPTYEQEAIERRPSLGTTPLAAMPLDGRDTRPLLDA